MPEASTHLESLEALANPVDQWAINTRIEQKSLFLGDAGHIVKAKFNEHQLGLAAAQINRALNLEDDKKINEQDLLNLIYSGLLADDRLQQQQALSTLSLINAIPRGFDTHGITEEKRAAITQKAREHAENYAIDAEALNSGAQACATLVGVATIVAFNLFNFGMDIGHAALTTIGIGIATYIASAATFASMLTSEKRISRLAEQKTKTDIKKHQDDLDTALKCVCNFASDNITPKMEKKPNQKLSFRALPKL